MKIDVNAIWHQRGLDKPENAEQIEKFVREFSAEDFYIEAANKDGRRYIHVLDAFDIKTVISDDLVMIENKDSIVFYSEVTRLQSVYWIMKRRPSCYEIYDSFYPPVYLAVEEHFEYAIANVAKRISAAENSQKRWKELMQYEGTETDPEQLNGKIRESVNEIIAGKDVGTLSLAVDKLTEEYIALHREVFRLKRSQQYHMDRSDKWEKRARDLYHELHGKDAPPQG